MLVLLPLPILFFPDGKISRRWRWTLGVVRRAHGRARRPPRDHGSRRLHRHPVKIDSSGELKQLGTSGGSGAGFAVVVLLFLGISLSWVIRQVVALPPLDAATGASS